MKETSKIDNFGCFIEQLGRTIQKLDDNFADSEGNINIKGLTEILKVAGFAYAEVKQAYEECLGKEFTIELGNDALESILQVLINLLPKPTEDTKVDVKVTTLPS